MLRSIFSVLVLFSLVSLFSPALKADPVDPRFFGEFVGLSLTAVNSGKTFEDSRLEMVIDQNGLHRSFYFRGLKFEVSYGPEWLAKQEPEGDYPLGLGLREKLGEKKGKSVFLFGTEGVFKAAFNGSVIELMGEYPTPLAVYLPKAEASSLREKFDQMRVILDRHKIQSEQILGSLRAPKPSVKDSIIKLYSALRLNDKNSLKTEVVAVTELLADIHSYLKPFALAQTMFGTSDLSTIHSWHPQLLPLEAAILVQLMDLEEQPYTIDDLISLRQVLSTLPAKLNQPWLEETIKSEILVSIEESLTNYPNPYNCGSAVAALGG